MIPAIYHLEAKVITRGVGRSAVAASAYMSCSEITNEYVKKAMKNNSKVNLGLNSLKTTIIINERK